MSEQNNIIQIVSHLCKKGIHHGPFIVDTKLFYVECGTCKEKLNPIEVLKIIGFEESMLQRRFESLKKKIEDLKKRFRVKCKNCGKMTDIKN